MQKYQWVRLNASGAVSTTPKTVMAVLLTSGTDNQTVKLTNDTNGSGTPLLELAALANSNTFLDLSQLSGRHFDTAVYGTLSGTGAIVYVALD